MGNTNKQPKLEYSALASYRDTECILLAELIGSPEYITLAQRVVKKGMFSVEAFGDVWELITKMNSQGEAIDLATVGCKIPRDVVIELTAPRYGYGCGTFTSVNAHCQALRDCYIKRTVSIAATNMLEQVANGAPAVDIAAMPEELARGLNEGLTFSDSARHISDVLNTLADTIQETQVARESGKTPRVPTGFKMLDYLTYSGFCAGDLVILAARPSVGKTAIMLQMARAAAESGKAVSIFSLEMTNQQLAQRLLFSTGRVTPEQLAEGAVNWNELEAANGEFDKMPLFLNDKARTLEDIAAGILAARGRCDIAFIDYLGLIQGANPRYSLAQAIAEKTARLKQLAKDCGIPIVLLCQLNRNSDSENRSPELRDLRDSGSIEQDSDVVLMVERETRCLNDSALNMWVRKNRQGRAGEVCVKLQANETFTRFSERS